MTVGIEAKGKHSVNHFDCPYDSPTIGMPSKKIVRDTVPYMNGYYDFSKLYGEVKHESREVEYPFDVISDTETGLHTKVAELVSWLDSIHEDEIKDDEIAGYHFVGTCDECDVDYEDEGFKATVTAKFTCQPFMFANEESTVRLEEGDSDVTNKGLPVAVRAWSEGVSIVTLGSIAQTVTEAEIMLEGLLPHGTTTVKVSGSPVTLIWREEVI